MEIITDERTYEGLPVMPAIVMAVMETTGIRQMIDDLCEGLDDNDRILSEGMAVKAMVGAMIERGKRPLYQISNYYPTTNT